MNWSTRFKAWSHEFYIGVKKVTWVTGVNSKLDDGNHFLMWDFDVDKDDKDSYIQVYANLLEAQLTYRLADIHLLDTGRGIHAYCPMSLPWREAFMVVERTLGVDPTYLKMAYVRGYFTLRFSEKSGRGFERLGKIPSPFNTKQIDFDEVSSFVRYETKAD